MFWLTRAPSCLRDGAEPDGSWALASFGAGGGKGEHRLWGSCGALLLIRSPSLSWSSSGASEAAGCAWGIHRYVHVCLFPTFMDACALVSAPEPACGETLFWEMQMVLGGQAAGWYPTALPYWELCVHLILCQPGLSPEAEKCPKSQNVPRTGKAFPTLL